MGVSVNADQRRVTLLTHLCASLDRVVHTPRAGCEYMQYADGKMGLCSSSSSSSGSSNSSRGSSSSGGGGGENSGAAALAAMVVALEKREAN